MKIKKVVLMRIIAIILLGQIYLLIVFRNLFFPFSSFLFISFCWFIMLLIIKPEVYLLKPMRYVYLFLILFSTFMYMGIYDIDLGWFQSNILPLMIAVSLNTYFIHTKDYIGLKQVVFCLLAFIGITVFTSIIGLLQDPLVARQIGGQLTLWGQTELIDFYQRQGIASYGFFVGMAFAIPSLISLIKIKWKNPNYKALYVGLILILLFSFTRAQMTAALMWAYAGALLAWFGMKNQRASYIILVIIILLAIVIPDYYVYNLIYFISDMFEGTLLQERLYDLALTLEIGEIGLDAPTHAGMRVGRIPFLIEEIKKNPFLGGGQSTGHVFWLDWISVFGFIGIIPWFLLIVNQVKLNLKMIRPENHYYYILATISFLTFGFFKNMGGQQMMIFYFFLAPGLLIIKDTLDIKLKDYQKEYNNIIEVNHG